MRYRLAGGLVGCWEPGRLVVVNPATGRKAGLPASAASVLEFFVRPRSVTDLVRASPAFGLPRARALVGKLARLGVLEETGGADRAPGLGEAGWAAPAALFHFWTKFTRGPGARRAAMEAELRRRVKTDPPPPPIKRHRSSHRVRLPRALRDDVFSRTLLDRRTWRGFSRRPLALDDLGVLLNLTWGVQRWGVAGSGEPVAFKTSPSGGARHSIEAYVVALRVAGLERGLYHYVADRGELEALRGAASPDRLQRYLNRQWWFRPAAAVVFMVSVLPRVWWRYPDPRSYRSVFLDAGHLSQTFCLVATWLALAPFCTAALDDPLIERDLGLDPMREAVVFAAGVGTRPPDGRWVQWPRRRRGRGP